MRADLHDPSRFPGCVGHFNTFGCGVRHGLFAIDIFARAHGINDDLLVPVVWDRCYEAVDTFVGEQFLITPSCGQAGIVDDLFRERVPAVVKIARCHAFHARQLNRVREQTGPLHSDPNDSEAHAVAGRDGLRHRPEWVRIKPNGFCGKRSSSNSAETQKFASGENVIVHAWLRRYFFSIFTATSLKKTRSLSL